MSLSSPYKPSPLSFGSPRTSPFRRPESPASPSTTIRPSTPTQQSTRPITPSKLQNASTPIAAINSENVWTPSGQNLHTLIPREAPPSPSRGAAEGIKTKMQELPGFRVPRTTGGNELISSDLAKLPPAQVREMREAFQILDRDSDGQVTRGDVAEMFKSLGLEATSSSLASYFPPSVVHPLSLPIYLSALSTLLAPLSPPSELLAAFAAFDDDDSGQISISELKDALLHTAPELGEQGLGGREVESIMEAFKGRREFGGFKMAGGGKTREEVFRYREFVASIGGATGAEGGKEER